ncbi:hypothetical protein M011DRAFT_516577 [Sporormia fimetaria CBS 119925]|uniref:NAD(P)-binding protein n=1 Tax=Sporormia fimetaria CBS 119925 TaxID=1340428 RepID=A0A6A6VQ40_9PLEO|nr:hypothetical protein M011DRAFT_516577 [Sporormia fimetaria CBS 119925]
MASWRVVLLINTVALTEIRAHNSTLSKALGPGLVAIFVGGTSGIGLSTARDFVRSTQSPHIYLIGRDSAAAERIIPEFTSLNPNSKTTFIKSDVSLLKNVDEACRAIKAKEDKVNLLFMTAGYFTMNGARTDTGEGLDRKLALHYYSRMRFIHNLQPLLEAAGKNQDPKMNLSRVVSVLDSGMGRSGVPNFADLALKQNFGLKACAVHGCTMNSYAFEHLAAQMPYTSFIHASPGMVATNVGRDMGPIANAVFGVVNKLTRPLIPMNKSIEESGERHLFASTAPQFAPRNNAQGVQGVARGNDEAEGSGSYAVDYNSNIWPESQNARQLRKEGAVDKIWKHTEEVFGKIFGPDGKY